MQQIQQKIEKSRHKKYKQLYNCNKHMEIQQTRNTANTANTRHKTCRNARYGPTQEIHKTKTKHTHIHTPKLEMQYKYSATEL